jgi:hypothetical protein
VVSSPSSFSNLVESTYLLVKTIAVKHQYWKLFNFYAHEVILTHYVRQWQYAQEVVAEAKNRGALFIDSHIDKAYIYTWLAWQKPPGRQLHNAIEEEILNPQHPKAKTFVTWFKTLYDL